MIVTDMRAYKALLPEPVADSTRIVRWIRRYPRRLFWLRRFVRGRRRSASQSRTARRGPSFRPGDLFRRHDARHVCRYSGSSDGSLQPLLRQGCRAEDGLTQCPMCRGRGEVHYQQSFLTSGAPARSAMAAGRSSVVPVKSVRAKDTSGRTQTENQHTGRCRYGYASASFG